jgi:ribonuclease PH
MDAAEKQLEAVLGAVAGAMVGTGEDMVVDLSALEDGFAAAGISCTATTNRGALAAEQTFLREELRTQRIRYENSGGELHGRDQELAKLIRRMELREAEISNLLWLER